MKRIIITSLMSFGCLMSFAQVTIEDCYDRAQANYPLIKRYDLIEKSKEYNLSNANKGYLPQVIFSAKATYQSDVTQLPIDLSALGMSGVAIPTLNRDQYGATIEINQTVWDGGAIKAQKESIRTAAEVEKKNNEISLYAINERVNQLFFGILLADAQLRQNKLLQDELRINYERIQSYIQNGVANQADADAIRVDLLKAEQIRIQFENSRKAYIEVLSKLTGEIYNSDTEFIKPEAVRANTNIIKRPELELFEAKIQNLNTKKQELKASVTPKIGIFTTGGYGRPGLNMLKNDFSVYGVVGAKISWNIGNFYTKKNATKIVENNINSVGTERETFLLNTEIDITQKNLKLDMYFKQLQYDDEIIQLRTSIKRTSEAKMANGTISGTDLSRDINAEQMAMQDKILHEMEMLLAIYNLKFVTNN